MKFKRVAGFHQKQGDFFMLVIRNLLNDRKGATAIEYGLIAGLVAVVIIGGLTVLGPKLSELFSTIAGKLSAVA